MAIAGNYLKYPEALALQMVLDLTPCAIGYAVKVAQHQVKRCWAGIKAVWQQAREVVGNYTLILLCYFIT